MEELPKQFQKRLLKDFLEVFPKQLMEDILLFFFNHGTTEAFPEEILVKFPEEFLKQFLVHEELLEDI